MVDDEEAYDVAVNLDNEIVVPAVDKIEAAAGEELVAGHAYYLEDAYP